MLEAGIIGTRGLQPDVKVIDELFFDVNTAYFNRNDGYEYAKELLTHQLAVKKATIIYTLSMCLLWIIYIISYCFILVLKFSPSHYNTYIFRCFSYKSYGVT